MDADKVDEQLSRIRAAIEEGDYEAATAAIEEIDIQTLESEHRGRVLGLTIVLASRLAQADADEAGVRRMLEEGLEENRDDPTCLTAAGIELADFGELGFAEKLCRRVCNIDSHDPVAYLNVGLCCYRDDRYETAISEFDLALNLDPDLALAHLYKARSHIARYESEVAAAAYRRYVELEPDDAHEWIWLGICESDMGRYDAAIEAFQEAGRLNPHVVSLQYNWLVACSWAKQRDDVAERLQVLEELAPEDPRTALARMYLAEHDGQIWQGWEHAIDALAKALAEFDAASSDFELPQHAADSALSYAVRNNLQEQSIDVIDAVFEHGLFAPRALRLIREIEGRQVPECSRYRVLVDGDLPGDEEQSDSTTGFIHAIDVAALSDEDANRRAMEFETRFARGRNLRVDQVIFRETLQDEYLGVLRTYPYDTYPKDSSD